MAAFAIWASVLAIPSCAVNLDRFLQVAPGNPIENGDSGVGARNATKVSAVAQPSWVPKVYGRQAFAAKFPKGARYVELGVFRGEFSNIVLHNAAPSKMILVDPWTVGDNSSVPGKEYNSDWRKKVAYSSNADMAHVQSLFKNEIKSGKVELKRAFSYEVVNSFEPASIDLLYIDACHMYECVVRDMHEYFPKVKPGGYMCGHDYCADNTGGSAQGQCGALWNNGVTIAVDEFVAKMNTAVAWSFLNPTDNDWCLLRKA